MDAKLPVEPICCFFPPIILYIFTEFYIQSGGEGLPPSDTKPFMQQKRLLFLSFCGLNQEIQSCFHRFLQKPDTSHIAIPFVCFPHWRFWEKNKSHCHWMKRKKVKLRQNWSFKTTESEGGWKKLWQVVLNSSLNAENHPYVTLVVL